MVLFCCPVYSSLGSGGVLSYEFSRVTSSVSGTDLPVGGAVCYRAPFFIRERGKYWWEVFVYGGSALPPPENNVRIWGYKGGETCYNILYEHGDC